MVNYHSERASAAEQAGDFGAAIRELRMAVGNAPSNARLHTALGVAFVHEGYISDAMDEFADALRFNSSDIDARDGLANALLRFGDVEDAIKELLRVLVHAPGDQLSRSRLALCYLRAGEWSGAAREYKILLQADPNSSELLYNLAIAEKHLDDLTASRAHLLRSIELTSDFPAAQFQLGQSYWEEGMRSEAKSEFQDLLKAHPDFSPAYFPLAEVLRQSGDLDGALAAIESALRVTESAAAYQELAILEKQGSNLGAAARAFHKAEQLKAIRETTSGCAVSCRDCYSFDSGRHDRGRFREVGTRHSA